MLITKREEVTKQGFCKILWRNKTPSSGKSLIRIYSLKWVRWRWALTWVWLGGGGGWRLFEARRLLTFSAFRKGAYSRWALIRGWALIRINTVNHLRKADIFLNNNNNNNNNNGLLTDPQIFSCYSYLGQPVLLGHISVYCWEQIQLLLLSWSGSSCFSTSG